MRLKPGSATASRGGSLLAWQQQLLGALRASTHGDACQMLAPGPMSAWDGDQRFQWRGVAAYRSNAALLAIRALGSAYPVLARLLGEENFDAVTRAFWQAQPPRRGDLAQWGQALAGYIESMPGLAEAEPFLGDVARVEWALHEAATAADATADHASFRLLASTDPALLRLELATATGCHPSRWPVVTLIEAHVCEPPALETAARRLACGHGETALVWRKGYRPMLRETQAGEAAFILAVQQGQSLHDALAQAADFDFSSWLAVAVRDGLLLRVAQPDTGYE
jgi:hypothetical protein